MGSAIVRNIAGALALIILSFIIGIMAADSAKHAALVIVAIAAVVGIIAMGKHVWITLFILPPVCGLLPKIGGEISLSYVLYAAVLCYWLVLRFLGYVKLTWRKLPVGDLFVIFFIILMAVSFYRNPVSISYLSDLENIQAKCVGGAAYAACICFLISYVCFSCIPFDRHILLKLLKWNLVLMLICQIVSGCLHLKEGLASGETSRYGMFVPFGKTLFIAVFCSAPFLKLIVSPAAIICFVLSLLSTLLSGFRSAFLSLGLSAIACIVIKREYYIIPMVLIVGVVSLGILNSSNTLTYLPFTMQRVLAGIPGIQVDKHIKQAADGSTNWRVEMWKWALDPRTGYIKNYMFGDGFGIDAAYLARSNRAWTKGEIVRDQQVFANSRSWHSSFIYTLQALGWIGVITTWCYLLYTSFIMYKVNVALKETPYFKYSMLYTSSIFVELTILSFSAFTTTTFFLYHLQIFVYLKVFHQIAVEEGIILPKKRHTSYVPLLIIQHKEQESIIRQETEKALVHGK